MDCLTAQARVELASRVVILSSAPASVKVLENQEESQGQLHDVIALRHASIVARLQGIKNLELVNGLERAHSLLVELKSESNVRLLDALRYTNISAFSRHSQKGRGDRLPIFLERPFAAGEVMLDTVMDTLLCKGFYCAECITVINLLAMGVDSSTNLDKRGSGSIEQREVNGQSFVQCISVPNACIGKTYAELFHYLLTSENQIALGLYRCVFSYIRCPFQTLA